MGVVQMSGDWLLIHPNYLQVLALTLNSNWELTYLKVKEQKIMWEEELVDQPNDFITSVNAI